MLALVQRPPISIHLPAAALAAALVVLIGASCLKTKPPAVGGARERIVPPGFATNYAAAADKAGDDALVISLDVAGHFELIAPHSPSWPAAKEAVLSLIGVSASTR